ncbi:glycosyltransferase [Candidatus Saccharibacteria bacterium]|nr:glycosyltransferase [Candidatus Saccharibacteria bacterium]
MKYRKIKVAELNNIDVYGKRFNGYDLAAYINKNTDDIDVVQLVNHKFSSQPFVKKIFKPIFEPYDYIIANHERDILKIKNQLSITEEALITNKHYKNADILHFHMYHNMNLPIAFLERISPSKQIVIDIHDTYWLSDSKIPVLDAFAFMKDNLISATKQRKNVLNSIDATFVVHSPYILELFKKSSVTKNLTKNVKMINFGIDTNLFKPMNNQDIRKKLHIPQGNIVLFCRAQKEFKGIDYIEKALSSIKSDRKITIITTNEKNLLKSLHNTHQIIDMGMVSDDKKMVELYNACDIFLAPSTEESFGFMAVEAMSCEKPVIVFNGTALPHTTNAPKIGISVNRNATSLQKAIEQLIANDKERIKRGKAGRVYVCKNYSLDAYYTNYVNLFRKLYRKNRTPHTKTKTPKTKVHHDFLEPINQFIFDKKTPQPPVINNIDYSDPSIQKYIQSFNHQIFIKIKKLKKKATPLTLIKRLIPSKIKRYIKSKLRSNYETK